MTVTTRAYRLLEGCRGITDEVLVCKHHPFGHSSGTTRVTYSDKVFWFRRLKGEDDIVTGPPSCFPLPPLSLSPSPSSSLSYLTTRSVGFSFPLAYKIYKKQYALQ